MATRDPGLGHIGPESYPEATYLPPMEDLRGMTVRDATGERIGTVDDVFVDESGAYVRYLSVGTGWFGTRRHLIPIDEVTTGTDEGELIVPYTRDQLQEAPAYEQDETITASHEADVYRHYGRPGYWEAIRDRQETPAATPEIARAEGERGEDLEARQTAPAPIPEIAEQEAEAAVARGEDPRAVRVKRWGV